MDETSRRGPGRPKLLHAPDERDAEIGKLRELLTWLAPRIHRVNGNGQVSDQFCLLCVLGQPMYRREPCRHGEIWEIVRETGKLPTEPDSAA